MGKITGFTTKGKTPGQNIKEMMDAGADFLLPFSIKSKEQGGKGMKIEGKNDLEELDQKKVFDSEGKNEVILLEKKDE